MNSAWDVTVEDFGKVEVTQEVSEKGLEHGSESSTLVQVEEETKDDLPDISPSDGEDEGD